MATSFERVVFRILLAALLLACADAASASTADVAAPQAVEIRIDASAPGTPFPHFWERMFGSGRAVLALRAAYRRDLSMVKRATGFDYVRMHGIFDRGVGLFHIGADGKPVYNFSYVDQIYDGLLARGVKPFVELGFMPPALAANNKDIFSFWYHPNVSPPKSYALWDAMIEAFARHLIARYGIDEVSTWYFEVWNEPNLGFWAGKPRQSTYFELYDHTARALQSVSPRLRVGGPATAQAAWVSTFLQHAWKHHVPVDFVSTHVYGDDTAQNVLHEDVHIPRARMVCAAVDKVHREIAASPDPHLPLIFSEYNASYMNLPNVTDSAYMGPWLAGTIAQCAGKVQMMSYWTFSDVFEEQGVVNAVLRRFRPGGRLWHPQARVQRVRAAAQARPYALAGGGAGCDRHAARGRRSGAGAVELRAAGQRHPALCRCRTGGDAQALRAAFHAPAGARLRHVVAAGPASRRCHAPVRRHGAAGVSDARADHAIARGGTAGAAAGAAHRPRHAATDIAALRAGAAGGARRAVSGCGARRVRRRCAHPADRSAAAARSSARAPRSRRPTRSPR